MRLEVIPFIIFLGIILFIIIYAYGWGFLIAEVLIIVIIIIARMFGGDG